MTTVQPMFSCVCFILEYNLILQMENGVPVTSVQDREPINLLIFKWR